jgi:hypothetical protein
LWRRASGGGERQTNEDERSTKPERTKRHTHG